MSGLNIRITGTPDVLKELDKCPIAITDMIKELYDAAMEDTFAGSQADVPVDKGDLESSGYTQVDDQGMTFCYEVIYGDGQSDSNYAYPSGRSTSQFTKGNLDADGYAMIVELGHMSRAGNPVPPQPYLGPNFDYNVVDLQEKLLDLFS